jgi:hypothetical protein
MIFGVVIDEGNVVIVSFTSVKPWKECPVIFRPWQNKRLFTIKTTISCVDARIVPVESLIAEANTNPNDCIPCMPEHSLKAVIGTLKSPYTPIEVLGELGKQYPTEYTQYVKPQNISANSPQTP